MEPSSTKRGTKRTLDDLGDDEDQQPAPKRRVLQWPQMNHRPSHASGTLANTSTCYSSGIVNHIISDSGSLFNPTAVPTSGEGFSTPENIGGNIGEDGNHHPGSLSASSQSPSASGAPIDPPLLPKHRRGIDPCSFTLAPIPQGEVLRGMAPPEEPRTLKDKITATATIIGRPFTKAEMNWVMATLWPDTVDYLGKGQKKRGQAVRPPNL